MIRFTIRDLLWLTLLAAVLVAWWVDRAATARHHAIEAARTQRLEHALRDSLGTERSLYDKLIESGFSGIIVNTPAELPKELRRDAPK